jgi:SAM-dependent methyltransferase
VQYLSPVSFEVSAEAYGRFMGRYSVPLASEFVTLLGAEAGQRALDVGCGAGALTGVLVERLGVAAVAAVDPSESFVAAVRDEFHGVDVRLGAAEQIPYPDETFDRTLAQLVVHFMTDPVAGLTEMARVTRVGGVVAANVWDHAGGSGPVATFWRAAQELDPQSPGESELAGVAEGQLGELFTAAGMRGARETSLSVRVAHPSFEQWWEPFTLGVGPAGEHVAQLEPASADELRERCRSLLPAGPFTVEASAWTSWWIKTTP